MTGLFPLCHVLLISPQYQNIHMCYIKEQWYSMDKQMYKTIDKNIKSLYASKELDINSTLLTL